MNTKRTKRQLAAIDKEIERIYYRIACGVQINMLDIPKIFFAGRDAELLGQDMEAAIAAKIAELRQN